MLSRSGAHPRLGALVAGCFVNGRQLLVVENGRSWVWDGDALIVATGSTDLPYPFPGATLPGVFSATRIADPAQCTSGAAGTTVRHRRWRLRRGRAGGRHHAGRGRGGLEWHRTRRRFCAPRARKACADAGRGAGRYAVDVIAIAVGRQADPALATMAGVPLGIRGRAGWSGAGGRRLPAESSCRALRRRRRGRRRQRRRGDCRRPPRWSRGGCLAGSGEREDVADAVRADGDRNWRGGSRRTALAAVVRAAVRGS